MILRILCANYISVQDLSPSGTSLIRPRCLDKADSAIDIICSLMPHNETKQRLTGPQDICGKLRVPLPSERVALSRGYPAEGTSIPWSTFKLADCTKVHGYCVGSVAGQLPYNMPSIYYISTCYIQLSSPYMS